MPAYNNISPELLSGVVSGDRRSQNSFFTQYKGLVLSIAFKYTRDSDVAHHLLSEIFCKLYKGVAFYNSDQGAVTTWVGTISRNHCIDYTRGLKNKKKINLVFWEEFFTLSDTYGEQEGITSVFENKKDLLDIMEGLSNIEHEILVLKYFKNLKFDDIAIELDINVNAAKLRAHRAKEKLFTLLTKD